MPDDFVFLFLMKLSGVKKYITELHKKQNDPYCWPDYLTGLPGKSAVLQKLEKVYPKIGQFGIAYVKISNIYPYLIKYGYERHAEIIEWAAAILHTTASESKDALVANVATHDFVVIARSRDLDNILEEASSDFRKRAASYYSPKDRKSGVILTYNMGDQKVCVGLMEFVHSTLKTDPLLPKGELIPYLAKKCFEMEKKWAC